MCCETLTSKMTNPTLKLGIITLVVFSLQIGCNVANALSCRHGYQTESSFLHMAEWNTSTCADGGQQATCLRARVSTVAWGVVEANITFGFCSNTSFCATEADCKILSSMAADALPGSDLDSFDLNSCAFSCCTTNHCNSLSLAKMKRKAAHGKHFGEDSILIENIDLDLPPFDYGVYDYYPDRNGRSGALRQNYVCGLASNCFVVLITGLYLLRFY